ncbi:MAG: Hsp20/alpha crystallin family protein [Anaerolineales bacterium]|jgi:HSP20 family protein
MANLTRFDPLRDMLTMRDMLDQMFDRSVTAPSTWQRDWDLALDVKENQDEFIVLASVPGIKPEDLDITYDNRTLTIKGEISEASESEAEGRYHLRERRFGSFSRSITLPSRVNPEKIQANYEAGVLSLHLPKAEEAKPKRIAIQNSDKVLEG